MSQWHVRRGNAATPWTNTKDSCWNETRSYQDGVFWYITRSYERLCWELEQNKNKFLFWPPRPHIFRITRGYLLHSLIFPHSLRIFRDFGTQIMNTAVFAEIFIFQKWVLFAIWAHSCWFYSLCLPIGHCGRNTHFRRICFSVPNFNFKYICFCFWVVFWTVVAVQRPSRRVHRRRLFFLPTCRYRA